MGKLQKMQYDRKMRERAEIFRWSRKQKYRKTHSKKKIVKSLRNMFQGSFRKKYKTKLEKLRTGEYISLEKKEQKLLRNKNFLNSQNYISSYIKKYKLFYYSKEKINNYRKSKIMINQIEKDLFERFYINFLGLLWKNKTVYGYSVYLGIKFLYLVRHK